MPLNLTVRLDENGVPVLDQAREAIASIESEGSGGYRAVGPKTRSGDRAYGRYQVMNVPAWTAEVLGQPMTPQQFLDSPEAQDAVFNYKFGQSVEKYGNVQDAASVWFSGKPLAQAGGRRDVLGTTPEQYVNKFSSALGGEVNPSPQFTPGRFGVAEPAPIATPAMGDVVPFQRKNLGFQLGTEGAARPGSFGSKWRTESGVRDYEASVGLKPNSLSPVQRPPASVREHPAFTETKRMDYIEKIEAARTIKPGDNLSSGTKVELHPATDTWMRGDRFGDIIGLDKKGNYLVRLILSGRKARIHPSNILRMRQDIDVGAQ